MPNETLVWIIRIRGVETEYNSIRFAVDHLLQVATSDSSVLKGEMRVRGINEASKRLGGTYIVRLFTEFETALRTFLHDQGVTRQPARAKALIDRVVSRMRLPEDLQKKAHAVREYWNYLVH